MLGITDVHHGAWLRRWAFEASSQCGLFSQLGYLLVMLSAPISAIVHGDGTGYVADHCQDALAVCSYGVEAGSSVSFHW